MVSDPSSYAGAQIRLVAVDMDGTLLDDEKNFPPGLDELLDHLEQRGVVFVPASGRQVWTLIDMFPERPGLTFIGENGAIVMRDGREISSAPLDLATVRESVRLVRQYALPRPGAYAKLYSARRARSTCTTPASLFEGARKRAAARTSAEAFSIAKENSA